MSPAEWWVRGRAYVPAARLLQRRWRGTRIFLALSARTAALETPTFTHVLEARLRIRPHLRPTPLYPYEGLSELVGAEICVKHENHQPTGAFKVRGGVNLLSQLSEEEQRRGVISASTGNHGQSIAYAARLFDVPATIVVPEGANPVKLAFIRAFGARIVVYGDDFDDAREHCEALAAEHGYRYVHSGNEPLLIAGVATETLEILEERPGVEVVIVPIGGGSGAAGACIAAKGVNPAVEVIGVQSDAAPAAYRSWRARELVDDVMGTFAEGLATRTAFELPQRILWDSLDDFVLVSEDGIRTAFRHMLEGTRNLVEPAGCAPLAAALELRDHLAGRRVALVASGGNVSPAQLRDLLGGI
jgi:threonine dehydratase